MNEGEVSEVVGVVKFSEPEACTKGQDKDEYNSGSEVLKKWTFAFWLIHLCFQGR